MIRYAMSMVAILIFMGAYGSPLSQGDAWGALKTLWLASGAAVWCSICVWRINAWLNLTTKEWERKRLIEAADR
jgi:hypothetical protein